MGDELDDLGGGPVEAIRAHGGAARPAPLVIEFWAGAIDDPGGDLTNSSQTGWSPLQALTGWLRGVAIPGYASAIVRGRSRQSSGGAPSHSRWSRVGRCANEAALPFYVLHLPVIVEVGWFVLCRNAFIMVKYFAVAAISFAGTLASTSWWSAGTESLGCCSA